MYTLLFLFGFVATTQAQILFGQCPIVTVQENFNVTQYMGRWYEIARYIAGFTLLAECVTADYELENGKVFINNTAFFTARGYRTILGEATQEDPDVPAKLTVNLEQSKTEPSSDYWVISTDYDAYSIVWACTQRYYYNIQFARLFSRSRLGFTNETMAVINTKLSENQISRFMFIPTVQSQCGNRV